MADVGHELGSLKMIVDKPLSSKVAMFNNAASKHKESQLLNPFSGEDGRRSPKPTFSKDEYGKPLAGSLTEMRGQKANIHVLKEMLELCQIIDSEGYPVADEPGMRVIPFGELFNIYNYISDKVVGICLRARKHKIIDFEGEMLFQRRDDNVPVFLLKPIKEIRKILEDKQTEIKRSASPAPPQATSVLLDQKRRSVSPAPKPVVKPKPVAKVEAKKPNEVVELKAEIPAPVETVLAPLPEPKITIEDVGSSETVEVIPQTEEAKLTTPELTTTEPTTSEPITIELTPAESTTPEPTIAELTTPKPTTVELTSAPVSGAVVTQIIIEEPAEDIPLPSSTAPTETETPAATDKASDENNNTETTPPEVKPASSQ